MRRASHLLVVALALFAVAGLLITSSGTASDAQAAVEYGKKAKKKKKKAIKKASKAIRDGQFVGARGGEDRDAVDWTLCKNGKYEIRTTDYYTGSTGVSKGKGWKVFDAKQTKSGFWAIVKFGKSGYVAMAKNGKQWKVGIDYFHKPSQMGNATRTNAKSLCKTL